MIFDTERDIPSTASSDQNINNNKNMKTVDMDVHSEASIKTQTTKYIQYLMVLGSIYILADASLQCCNKDNFAEIAIGFPVLTIILLAFKLIASLTEISLFAGCESTFEVVIAILLLITWITGVAFFTFTNQGVFKEIGVGYLWTWLLAALTIFNVFLQTGFVSARTSATKSLSEENVALRLAIFLLATVGLLVVGSIECAQSGCSPRERFALAFGIISFLFIVVFSFYAMDILGNGAGSSIINYNLLAKLSLVCVILWAVAIYVLTLEEPFFRDGSLNANGFFSTWISFISSAALLSFYAHLDGGQFLMEVEVTQILLIVAETIVIASASTIKFICEESVAGSGTPELNTSSSGFIFDNEQCTDFRTTALTISSVLFATSVVSAVVFRALNMLEDRIPRLLSYVVTFLWIVAAIVLTFPGTSPFVITNSGYVALWLCVYYSGRLTFQLQDGTQNRRFSTELAEKFHMDISTAKNLYIFVGLVAAVVLLLATLSVCVVNAVIQDGEVKDNTCDKNEFFVFAAGAVTVLLLFLIKFLPGELEKLTAGALALLWLVSAPIITIDGTFKGIIGNGFYSSWILTLISVLIYYNLVRFQ